MTLDFKNTMSAKTLTLTSLILSTALLVSGCKDDEPEKAASSEATTPSSQTTSTATTAPASKDEMVNSYVNEMNTLADALEAVDGEAGVAKAAEAIATMSTNMDALAKKFQDRFTDKQANAAFASNPNIMLAQTRVSTAMLKLASSSPQLMGALSQAMVKIGKPAQ